MSHTRSFSRWILLLALLIGWGVTQASAQYNMPPQGMIDLVDAPATPSVSLSPDSQVMLLMGNPSLPSISDLAQPELRIAGMRINPRNNARSRTRGYNGLSLKQIADLSERAITGLPAQPKIGAVMWSPNGRYIAFTQETQTEIQLWLADVAQGTARRLTDHALNATYGNPCGWVSNSETLICRTVPMNRGAAPTPPLVPEGPITQENLSGKAPVRTYQDLLQNPHDEALFTHYLTAQVVKVSVDGRTENLGQPAIITRASASPDGMYLLVETVHEPFSYLVPSYRFPRQVVVWDMQGRLVKEIADLPLIEQMPTGFGATQMGPRSFSWRADAAATLYWVEAQDGGDPRAEVDIRDRVYTLNAPFTGASEALVALKHRYAGMMWGHDGLALAMDSWWWTRERQVYAVNPQTKSSRVLLSYSTEDRYNNPGSPMFTLSSYGTGVLMTGDDGQTLFMRGTGASPEGDRPFLDKLNVATGETTRLWRSEAPHYERVIDVLSAAEGHVITLRESKEEPPNYIWHDLQAGAERALTAFPHPAPQLRGISKEQITYMRNDGVQLSATLYLPAGYNVSQGPLPMLMWAYPREFKDANAASQVIGSPYRFTRVSSTSPLMFLTEGYAILDGPTMPIIGEGDQESNDTFVEQLVASAKAAVDEVVSRGVADPDRIAIAGHSYGAFMTANLLSHSDLFAAGIARSGAYNRTLTPFGFQAEQRTFWEAPEVYFRMSPFMHAHKVNEPILLIHGEADNNSGTFPVQSRRYYAALKGHGATSRLVMLPHESHGYRARESVLHVLHETLTWLDTYVKNRSADAVRIQGTKGGG